MARGLEQTERRHTRALLVAERSRYCLLTSACDLLETYAGAGLF
jgi:hypothetical protein